MGLEIAGFATWTAVVKAVFTEANVVEALAQAAEPIALAALLGKVADGALKQLRHERRLSRLPASRQ